MEPDIPRGRPLRSDAQANREALIQAAAICFEREGLSVALEKIISKAGVGRGTFYRHFNDRTDLLVAVLNNEMDPLADAIAPDMSLPQAIEAICLVGSRLSALVRRVSSDFAGLEPRPELFAIGKRFERMLEPGLERSRAAGEISQSTTIETAALAAQMVNHALLPNLSDEEKRVSISRGLAIVMNGLKPRSRRKDDHSRPV